MDNKAIDFGNLSALATLDLEGDKKHDPTEGALPKIKPLVRIRTALRAGMGTRVGFARA